MTQMNPARLLHRHLANMRRGIDGNKGARFSIATSFNLSSEDDALLRRALVLFDGVFAEAEKRFLALPRADHERLLRYFPQLRKGLANVVLDNPAAGAFTFITDAALENLDMGAARIAEDYVEEEISAQELEELEKQVVEMLKDLNSAGFEPRLREVGLDLVETLRHAILEYRVRGVDGLSRAVAEALGRLTLYYREKDGAVPQDQFGRLWKLVVITEAVVSRALTYGPLLVDTYTRFLGPGTPS